MEKFCYNFYTNISKLTPTNLIALRKSQKYLPFFYISALTKALFVSKKNVDIIHIGDALLSPLGVILKFTRKIPVTITVYGLDVIFPNKIYQFIIPKCLKRLDKIICISQETKNECIKRGINPASCSVIPVGLEIFHQVKKADKKKLIEDLIHTNINNKKILLSVGRLIDRKGIPHFLKNIFPAIKNEYPEIIYLIVGSGKLKSEINLLIKELGLGNNVYLLENVDDISLNSIYQISDIFVMPNIPVKGDMEGFGIVLLEASSAGLPVVASNIEGIKDAIIDNKNGFLIEPYDTEKYVKVILDLLRDDNKRISIGRAGKEITNTYYNWEAISEKYLDVFNSITGSYNKVEK
jgi:phosphatidylinositol alpha-1,6-mannosyltransferase